MKKYLLGFIFGGLTFLSFSTVAQITGTTSVSVGQTVQYRLSRTRIILEGCPYWSLSGNGTEVYQDARTFTINWTAAGTATIWFSDDCAGIFSSLSVTILGPACTAATPNATFGYSANTCGKRFITYTTGPPSGETWYWQDNALGISMANSTNTYQVMASGTYYIRSYANCGTWSGAVATAFVTYNLSPVEVTTFTSGSRCGSGSVALSAVPGANGTVVRWYDAQSGGNLLASSNSYTTASLSSTTNYYVSSFNESTGCESTRSTTPVVATVNSLPPPPNPASPAAGICGSGSITLTAYPPYGMILWYAVPSGGSPLNSPSNTYTTPVLTTTTTYYAEHIYGNCASPTRLAVVATVNAQPSSPTAPDVQTCFGFPATLIATPGSNANTVRWYNQSTGGTLLYTGIPYNTSAITSPTSYYHVSSYNSTTNCESVSRVLVTVTANNLPSGVTSFTSRTICGSGSTNLDAVPGSGGNSVRWYSAQSGGSLLFTGTTFTTPGLTATTNYYVSTYNTTTGCESSRSTTPVVATVNSVPPPPNPASSVSRCGAGSLTLTAYPPYGMILWYATPTGGSPLSSPNNTYTTPTLSITTTYYAEHIYGGCASTSRLAVAATVNPVPAAPTASGKQTCYGKSVNLTATPGSNGNQVRWYSQASGNNLLQTGTSYTTPQLTSNTSYFLTSFNTISNCESSTRLQITVTVDPATNNQNYIKAEEALVGGLASAVSLDNATVSQKTTSYQYFDGLGRLIQTIGVNDSPTQKNTITPVVYDQFGRAPKTYLPYTVTQECIDLRSSWSTEQTGFYNPSNGVYNNRVKTDPSPFSTTVFEASPLNRVLQQGAPGSAWQPDAANSNATTNKAVKNDYLVNVDGTLAGQERIALWNVVSNLPTTSSFYASSTLFVNVTRDEENRQVRSYVDKEGRTILKKVQYVASAAVTNDDAQWTLTYYVYDDIGNLRFVLPPEFCTRIGTYNAAMPANKQASLNTWAFQYQYDERQRMISKQVPGAEATEMVYDKYNRLVFTRDGNQRFTNKWLFTKYDQLNRPIMTGELSSTANRAAMQLNVNNFYTSNPTNRFESTAAGSIGYTTATTYPNTIALTDVLTISYYDDYSFITNLALGTAYNFNPVVGFTSSYNQQVKGLATGSKTKILPVSSSNWLVSVSYYDDRYRPLQSVSDDHKGNKNRVTNAYYGITSWVTKSQQTHGSAFTRLTETDYDHRGRVLRTFSTLDGGTRTLLAFNTYNELGQLVEKNLHSTDLAQTVFLQSNDYRYNIRGWMTHINNSQLTNDGTYNNDANDLFGMQLLYNDAAETVNGTLTQPQFNGNIAATKWKMNNLVDASVEKVYSYAYDPLNRLKTAGYATGTTGAWTGAGGNFDEQLDYDKNGNIKSLNRYGLFGGSKQLIDQLSYEYKGGAYNSNQLQTVTDASAHYQPGKKDAGFVEATHAAGMLEMDYDYNGNLKYDLNKSITAITYNYLNLPTLVTMSGGKTIEYTYDAAGTKLKYKAVDNGTVLKESDYINGIQYEAGQLAFVMTGEGRAMKRGTNWEYEYHLKDHLGNTRVAFGNLQDVVGYSATMETEKATTEEIEQNSTTGLKHVLDRRDGMFNHTLADKDSPTPSKSAWLNGGFGREVGPGKKLDVSNGDKLKMEVYVRYAAGSGNASDVVASLIGAVTTTFNITAGENPVAYNGMNSYLPGYTNAISNSGEPKAYINYILFNANYTSSQYGYVPMPNTAVNGWQKLSLDITVPMNGFAYVWVSNESNYNVYFDDLKIIHEKTTSSLKVVQAQDYYPFGLTFNSYNRENSVTNKYLYTGMELQTEFDLGWFDYLARQYDPAMARFTSIDPAADFMRRFSTYAYAFDNPVRFTDPDGMAPDDKSLDEWRKEKEAEWDAIDAGAGIEVMGAFDGAFKEDEEGSDRNGQQQQTQGSGPETWYYMLKTEGGPHGLVYDPTTNTIYDANHPNDGRTNGLISWLTGNAKSMGYKFNMSNPKDVKRFWEFGGGRGELMLAPISIADPGAARAFFESNTGKEWDYNFFTNNCKHYACQGFEAGGAYIPTMGPAPQIWSGSLFIGRWNSSMSTPYIMNGVK